MTARGRTGGGVAARRERRRSERSQHPRRAGAGIWRGPLPYVVASTVIVAAIGWSVWSSRAPAPSAASAAADAVVASVTTIPADVFDRVGTGGLTNPLRATSLEMQRGASGKPLVIYVGAEYCPYCASEKWSLVAALARFGTFEGLALSTSSSTDAFPDTPTFTFRGATYRSGSIEVSMIETADRQGRIIAQMTPVQKAAYERSDPEQSIPFLSIAERHVQVGSGYRPDILVGRMWMQIADQMRDPGTPLARGVIGNANWITAAICEQTGGQPTTVCDSPGVRATQTK